MRASAVALPVLLALAGSSLVPTNPATIRIATFNAEWLVDSAEETEKDPWGSDFGVNHHAEVVAGIIETLHPDIINLVEVTSKQAVDHLVDTLHEKGLTEYRGFHIESDDTATGQDIAFLTTLEPDTVEGVKIRKMSGPAWRQEYFKTSGADAKPTSTGVSKNIEYYFTIGGQKIGFLGLHLIAHPDDPQRNAQRMAQSLVAQRIIRDEIVARGYAPIVLGDLNDYDGDFEDAWPGLSTVTSVLHNLKDYDPNHEGDELVNACSLISRRVDRYSSHWDKNNNMKVDEGEPMTLLDHLLLPTTLVPQVKRIWIDHGHTTDASDHFPVVVDIQLGTN